jgi:hypothetical protein
MSNMFLLQRFTYDEAFHISTLMLSISSSFEQALLVSADTLSANSPGTFAFYESTCSHDELPLMNHLLLWISFSYNTAIHISTLMLYQHLV